MSNKETLEKLVKMVTDMRQELSLLREDFDDLNIEFTAFKQEAMLTQKNDQRAKKDIKQEIQIANDRTVAAVTTQVESVKDIVEDKKVIHYKKPWFNWFKKGR